jgi:hypothetical protein
MPTRQEKTSEYTCKSLDYIPRITQLIVNAPRVEADKNTSTVIPASRKRRQKGNPVVLGETVLADLKKKVNEDLSLDKPLQVIYRITAN